MTIALTIAPAMISTSALAVVPGSASAASTRATSDRPALSKFDTRLLADINHARVKHGLRKLVAAAGTTDIAHGWSCVLATTDALAHNPALEAELATHGSRAWTNYSENVGSESRSMTADQLFHAYMHSAPHRANILASSERYIGIWTKTGHGMRFNTLDFVGSTKRSYRTSYGSTRVTC